MSSDPTIYRIYIDGKCGDPLGETLEPGEYDSAADALAEIASRPPDQPNSYLIVRDRDTDSDEPFTLVGRGIDDHSCIVYHVLRDAGSLLIAPFPAMPKEWVKVPLLPSAAPVA